MRNWHVTPWLLRSYVEELIEANQNDMNMLQVRMFNPNNPDDTVVESLVTDFLKEVLRAHLPINA